MIALGYLAEGILGTNTVIDGLACTPTVPASLAVSISDGSIYSIEPIDSIDFSSLPLDSIHQVIKQGIALSSSTLTMVPPSTSGQAINYLIEASFVEQDTGSTTLPYFNSTNPSVPFSGPAGSGIAQPTLRQGLINLIAQPGVSATAGTQITPAPDAGYVGMWVVTVANGATTITSANIALYPPAPFISVKLPQLPTWVQAGSWDWAADTGSANAIVTTLTPSLTTYTQGMSIFVRKMNAPNTGPMTFNGGPGAVAIINADTSVLSSGQSATNFLMHLVYDGTSFRFMNGTQATSVGALTASAGEGIAVSGGAVVSRNDPSLTTQNTIANNDLWSFYSQVDVHHRVLSWSQLIINLRAVFPPTMVNLQKFEATGVYTPSLYAKNCLVFVQGAGGGGASGFAARDNLGDATGGGGGAGARAIVFTAAVTTTVTIAIGGVGGGPGSPGSGPTSFGTLAVAGPGQGGKTKVYYNGTQHNGEGGLGGIATAGFIRMSGEPGETGGVSVGPQGGAALESYGDGGDGSVYPNAPAGTPGVVFILEFS